MATSYPGLLDTTVTLGPDSGIISDVTTLSATGPGQNDQLSITKNLINCLVAIEAKLGVSNSLTVASHEYRIRKIQWKQWTALDAFGESAGIHQLVNSIPFLSFALSATTSCVFIGIIPFSANLTSGAIVRIIWGSSATTGNVVWSVAFEREGITPVTSDSFDVPVTQVASPNATTNLCVKTSITVTNLDTAISGDTFRLQLQRLGLNASDTMVAPAQVFSVTIESAL